MREHTLIRRRIIRDWSLSWTSKQKSCWLKIAMFGIHSLFSGINIYIYQRTCVEVGNSDLGFCWLKIARRTSLRSLVDSSMYRLDTGSSLRVNTGLQVTLYIPRRHSQTKILTPKLFFFSSIWPINYQFCRFTLTFVNKFGSLTIFITFSKWLWYNGFSLLNSSQMVYGWDLFVTQRWKVRPTLIIFKVQNL